MSIFYLIGLFVFFVALLLYACTLCNLSFTVIDNLFGLIGEMEEDDLL